MEKTCAQSVVGIIRVDDVVDKTAIRDAIFHVLSQMKENCCWRLPPKATIMIKVNLCLVKEYLTGATVDPFVARCVSEWLISEFDPGIIYIGEADATELNADIAFKALGWEAEFEDVGRVKLINLAKDDLIKVKLDKGLFFRELDMSKKYMEADFLVSLAKLKTNEKTGITCILKNQFGITPVKYKAQYHSNLNEAIHDLNLLKKPDLCMIDGIIAMEGVGPVDGIAKPMGLLIAGNDPVATDHACAKIMCVPLAEIPSLRLSINKKLGSTKYTVLGSQINEVKTPFARTTRLQKLVTGIYVSLRKFVRSVRIPLHRRDLKIRTGKMVKVGIIGLGAVSEVHHLPVLSTLSGCEIVAASEKDPMRGQRRKQEWNIPLIYEDYREMLRAADLDAVFICLPTFMHFDAVKCALEHNVHVFCEKPLGLSSDEAHELVTLASKSNLCLTVGYSRMLNPNYQKARDIIKSRRLGEVLQIRGVLSFMGPYAGWAPRSDWFFDTKGGGVLFDSGSHLFSIFMHVLDDRIIEVSAVSTTTYAIPGMNDQIGGSFRTEKGVLGTFNLGWKAANESNTIEIIGSGGSIVVDSIGVEEKLGSYGTFERIANRYRSLLNIVTLPLKNLRSPASSPIIMEDEAFIKAVAGGGCCLFSGDDAVHVLAVLDAIRKSIATGTKIKVTCY